MSDTEKIIFICVKCSGKLRVPVLDKLIRFQCPDCKEKYTALRGKVSSFLEDSSTDLPKSNITPEEQNKPSKPTHKTLKSFLNNILIWRLSTLILTIAIITGFFLMKDERQEKIRLSNQLIGEFKKIDKKNFNIIKNMLSDESRKLFEIFIESQYVRQDSLSIDKIQKFANSLTALEFSDLRIVRYRNSKNDTAYFALQFIPDNGKYLINVDIEPFLK